MTRTVWRVTATPLTRRSSTHHGTLDTTTRNASVSSQVYRLFEQAIATTTTRDPTVRLLYVVVSLLLQNVWRYLHYEYVATPRRGGRRLWWWPYKEFVNMIRRAAWTGSRCVGLSPRIGHLTTDSTANHRPSKPAEEWRRCRVGG